MAGGHPKPALEDLVLVDKTEVIAPFGGSQMGDRKIFGIAYSKDGLIDNTMEAFAGPHDAMSSWNYKNTELGTVIKDNNLLANAASGLLLIPSIPFAATPFIQDNLEILQAFDQRIEQDKQEIKDLKNKDHSQ